MMNRVWRGVEIATLVNYLNTKLLIMDVCRFNVMMNLDYGQDLLQYMLAKHFGEIMQGQMAYLSSFIEKLIVFMFMQRVAFLMIFYITQSFLYLIKEQKIDIVDS